MKATRLTGPARFDLLPEDCGTRRLQAWVALRSAEGAESCLSSDRSRNSTNMMMYDV